MYSGQGSYNMDAPAAGELLGLQSLANVNCSIHVLSLLACQCVYLLVSYADCLAAIGILIVQRVHVLSCCRWAQDSLFLKTALSITHTHAPCEHAAITPRAYHTCMVAERLV